MTLDEILALPQPLSDEHRKMVHEHLLESMTKLGAAYLSVQGQVRKKPLIGGAFGSGKYVLCSHNRISSGLDRPVYFVLEERTWLAIGHGDTVEKALEYARALLSAVDPSMYARFVSALVFRRAQEAEEQEKFREEERAAWLAQRKTTPVAKSIPKRRREIFEASDGKCHYCRTALTLDGKWHIEHKMPKALMGGNEPSNLVASCAPCNHKKRDKTDQEFIAQVAAA